MGYILPEIAPRQGRAAAQLPCAKSSPYNSPMHAKPDEEIRTARLLLRPPRMADAPAIYVYAQDPEVTRYVPWAPHQAITETMEFLRGAMAAWQTEGRYPWVLTLPPADTALGMIELRPADRISTMGYVLRRSAWGQGLMTEAARAVVDEGLDRLGLYRVAAFCDVENLASARVLEKAGLVLEGRLRRFQPHPNLSPEPRDVLLYAKTR